MQDRIVYDVPVADIAPSPHNPRQQLDGLNELAESIRSHGLLQPIVVRRIADGYELIAGHRRLAAVRQLGWVKVPANVREEDSDDAYILTLVENLQREDLTPKEEDRAYGHLLDAGATLASIARAVGVPASRVRERLALLDYFVLRRGPSALRYPDLDAELANQPYFVVRQAPGAKR